MAGLNLERAYIPLLAADRAARGVALDERFNLGAVPGYEKISLPGSTGTYRLSAEVISSLGLMLAGEQEGAIIADLGCGTGNSTLVFAHNNPGTCIIGLDPSRGFLTAAAYKLSLIDPSRWAELADGIHFSGEVMSGLEQRRESAVQVSQHVRIIQSWGQELPLPTESLDRVYGVQSFHWLAFSPQDAEGKYIDYLLFALSEIHRVLKPGGWLIFDESGHQFDFGALTLADGTSLNQLHQNQHPFHIAFCQHFNDLVIGKGLVTTEVLSPHKVDPWHNMFNYESLKELLEVAGFELQIINSQAFNELVTSLIPSAEGVNVFETVSGGNYQAVARPLTSASQDPPIVEFIKGAGFMRYFVHPALAKLSTEEKNKLLLSALTNTLKDCRELASRPAGRTVVYFAAKAI